MSHKPRRKRAPREGEGRPPVGGRGVDTGGVQCRRFGETAGKVLEALERDAAAAPTIPVAEVNRATENADADRQRAELSAGTLRGAILSSDAALDHRRREAKAALEMLFEQWAHPTSPLPLDAIVAVLVPERQATAPANGTVPFAVLALGGLLDEAEMPATFTGAALLDAGLPPAWIRWPAEWDMVGRPAARCAAELGYHVTFDRQPSDFADARKVAFTFVPVSE